MFKRIKDIGSMSILIVFVLTLATAVVSADSIQAADLEAFIEDIMHVKLEKYHIPNAAISVVKEGQIAYKKGFGFADIENNIPVDGDNTLFRIGSTSKLITWTAVMQLVEKGKLDLNADINTYLDFEIPPRLTRPLSKTIAQPITMTHLMTHTPGFEDYPDMLFRLSEDELMPLNEYIRRCLPARIFPAGEVAAYSNYGTALAGYIVERVSGLSFSEYIEENIFQPLRMNKSTYRQPAISELSPQRAKPYRFIDGAFIEGSFEYLLPEPAGSMSTTASDMSRFMIAHLGGAYEEGQILKEETLKLMQKQHFTHHSALGGMALGFMEGIYNGKGVIFHGGGTMLFSTGLYLLPEEKTGIFISYSGGDHLLHSEVFQEFMDYYYPAAATPITEAPREGSRGRAQRFIGEYQMNRRSVTTAEKATSLMLGVISINMDDEGYLLVNKAGETNRFIEVEPGVYKNLKKGRSKDYFGPFHRIVFKTDPYGKVMLTTDGPMTYSRAPFYSTMSFTAIALIILLLILISALVYWIIIMILGLVKGKKAQSPRKIRLAQWIGICAGMAVLIFLAGTLSAGDINPVYQLPKDAYIPVEAGVLSALMKPLIIILTLSLTVFCTIAWTRKSWGKLARIHYTLFTFAVLGLMWMFNYWNLL